MVAVLSVVNLSRREMKGRSCAGGELNEVLCRVLQIVPLS